MRGGWARLCNEALLRTPKGKMISSWTISSAAHYSTWEMTCLFSLEIAGDAEIYGLGNQVLCLKCLPKGMHQKLLYPWNKKAKWFSRFHRDMTSQHVVFHGVSVSFETYPSNKFVSEQILGYNLPKSCFEDGTWWYISPIRSAVEDARILSFLHNPKNHIVGEISDQLSPINHPCNMFDLFWSYNIH